MNHEDTKGTKGDEHHRGSATFGIPMTSVARWISIVAHPFVLTGVLVAGVALRLGSARDAFESVIIVGALTVLPLGALMVWQVRRGSWDNVDASNRTERPILFAVGIAALFTLLGYAIWFRPQSFLVRGGVGTLMMLALCAAVTRWIKISLHVAFATLAATTLLLIGSPAGWILLVVLPFLAWSRLAMFRHTPLEVTVGAIVGVVTAYAMVRL